MLKMVVGLVDQDGETQIQEIDSELLLTNLIAVLDAEGGAVFESMTDTDMSVVYPEEYEEACRQLGLIQGFAMHGLSSLKN